MAKGQLKVIKAMPGLGPAMPAIKRLLKAGEGFVTSFADPRLRAVAEYVPPETGVEILPFGAVVVRFLQWTGASVDQLPQRGLVEAAVAQACQSLEADSPFFATRIYAGLHKRLAEAFELLRNWDIDDARLLEIAEKCARATSIKLKYLAQIQRETRAILSDLGRTFNADNILQACDLALPQSASFPEVVILAGSEYSPIYAKWIKWICAQGVRVTVYIDHALDSEQLFEDGADLAADLGIKPSQENGENPFLEALFSNKQPDDPQIDIKIMSASDPLAEVEWALRGFAEVHESGTEWDRLALFARDIDTYGPLIQAASLSLGVPVQVARRGPVLANGFARMVLQALKFLASNDVRTIGPVLRSTYVGLTRSQCEQVLAAAKASYGNRETQWQTLMEWAELHTEDIPWLKPLLAWRHKALNEPASLALWADRIKRLPEEQPWLDRSPVGQPLRQRDSRIHTAMQRELANRASVRRVRQDEVLTLGQFVKEAEAVWSQADCSIPPNPHGVRVFSQTDGLDRVESLHVLGMLEGVFPRRRSEDPILTDLERAEISLYLETRPLPDSHREARRERDQFYRLCATASKRIVCSYPLTDEERDNVPAFYLEELARIAGTRLKRIDRERTYWAPPLEECSTERDRSLAEALAGEREPNADDTLTVAEAIALSMPVANEAFSPRQLRDAYECPFRFFAHHRLKLRSPGRLNIWSNLIQLPRAAALPLIETKGKARDSMKLALETEIDKVSAELSDWQIGVIRAGGERLIEEWVEREFAKRENWSLPGDTTEELITFGESKTRGVLKTNTGESVPIQGSIPALTRQGKVNIGHLYRRSQFKVESGSKFEMNGSALELGAYLAAIFEKGKAAALDVETMSDRRLLYITDFEDPLSKFTAPKESGLEVKPLGPPDKFFDMIKEALGQALSTVKGSKTNANPDDHCTNCDMGEICRRSKDFSEEDSPFDE